MKYFVTTIWLIFSIAGYAQNRTIKGKVLDHFETTLAEVYIYNPTTGKHTHTIENGMFSLPKNNQGDTLVIRLLGFETKRITLKENDFVTPMIIKLDPKIIQLDELILTQEIDPINVINKIDIKTNPVNSSQEILRKVPGLFIGQHAGGGKAEQIFLRGFDVDHGTDVAISVDGMPVNMVSHAHGQGYADLHFVIPETIKNVDFGKGPHYANQGNFNTAGYVSFSTREKFDANQLHLEIGKFNTFRTLGLFNLLEASERQKAILALEYIESDGPFESPQNFNRINLHSKYTTMLSDNNKVSLAVSHFTSRWDASGQIPIRAVESELISRFGAIDDTEGGTTSRTNINGTYSKFISDKTTFITNVFYSHYDFELYSNFTFFLNDPINGDQIKQREDRTIFGFSTKINHKSSIGDIETDLNFGFGLRNDNIKDNELSRTLYRRETLENISLGNVNETNTYAFINTVFDMGKVKITPAIRLDYFKNLYEDALLSTFETKATTKAIASPKFKISYDFLDNFNVFVKTGIGFHSNDTRVVIARQGNQILPKAYGADLGINWKPFSDLFVNSTAWYLGLEQEFVYVGDEGIVEPSGKTRRLGIDFSARYQLNKWLFFDSDFTYTYARSIEASEGEDYIPLAPKVTATGGISVDNLNNFSGGIQYRYLGDRAANEDHSIIATGYTVIDANLNYEWNNISLGVAFENLLNTEWNEAQFATESRLNNELEPTEEIHFTPGAPFFVKGTITYSF